MCIGCLPVYLTPEPGEAEAQKSVTDVLVSLAMADRRPNSWIDRANRRGCFIIMGVLLLLIAALVFIGFHGDPINAFEATIPVQPR